ncbi:MAG: phage shock protein operon transcriptional activator [Halioglobus sp.]
MRTQEGMVGNSQAFAEALDRISYLAPINRPVLILGERGTGKELAAERLHFLSTRWDAPLVKVNCAAIAESLLESELFGHEPGAFTGATRTRQGRFERADGGTLFLDEIATMSGRLQEKLLRLVEYGEFERLGGQETLRVDVRIAAATNADLRAMADDNLFRHDLLDRLSFDVVHLPALCQRMEDIEPLAQHFAILMTAELGWEMFPGFSAKALSTLQAYRWPGNVRELKNVVERSIYRWGDPTTPVDEIVIDPFVSPYPAVDAAIDQSDALLVERPEHTQPNAANIADQVAEPDFTQRMESIERKLVEEALAKNGHNQRLTADTLGLTYDQVRGLVRKHGLGGRRRRH